MQEASKFEVVIQLELEASESKIENISKSKIHKSKVVNNSES